MTVSMGMRVAGIDGAIQTLESVRTGFNGSAHWIVGVGAEYGAYVEFGTSRMAAQPYLFPAARQAVRTHLPEIVAKAPSASEPLEYIVANLALAIERIAKDYAPVDTGFLRGSIEAAPAGAFA